MPSTASAMMKLMCHSYNITLSPIPRDKRSWTILILKYYDGEEVMLQ
jgi:hypothetical protein